MIPLPGQLNEQNRINVADRSGDPIQHVYFEFKYGSTSKQFFTVPVGNIISNLILIRIEDQFDGSDTDLQIGTVDAPASVGRLDINAVNFYHLDVTNSQIVASVLQRPVNLYWSILELGATKSTKGKGWGLLELININKVVRV